MTGDAKLLWKFIRQPVMDWWRKTGMWLIGLAVLFVALEVFSNAHIMSASYSSTSIPLLNFLTSGYLIEVTSGVIWLKASAAVVKETLRAASVDSILEQARFRRAAYLLCLLMGIPSLIVLGLNLAATEIYFYASWGTGSIIYGSHHLTLTGFAAMTIDSIVHEVSYAAIPFFWYCAIMVAAGRFFLAGWILWIADAVSWLIVYLLAFSVVDLRWIEDSWSYPPYIDNWFVNILLYCAGAALISWVVVLLKCGRLQAAVRMLYSLASIQVLSALSLLISVNFIDIALAALNHLLRPIRMIPFPEADAAGFLSGILPGTQQSLLGFLPPLFTYTVLVIQLILLGMFASYLLMGDGSAHAEES